MESKKISFGFSKVDKKLNLLPKTNASKSGPKVELIKCLEDQQIKLIEKKQKEAPLIIPVKGNETTTKALASLKRRRAVLLGEQDSEDRINDDINNSLNHENHDKETLEQRAARELLQAVQGNDFQNIASNLVLPIVKPEELPLDGAKVSTLDDYESVPIQEFGKAMLRGMGWVEPFKLVVNKSLSEEIQRVRPKGMGLGVDKVLKPKPLLIPPENNEVLEIKRNAFVRILGGKHKDLYGQIEGFDDHAGRIIVKMAVGGLNQTFNEFLCQPVSRKEYAQYGKCINNAEFRKYKRDESAIRPEKKHEGERAHNQGHWKPLSSSHWQSKPSATSDSSNSTKTDSNSDSAYEQQIHKKSDSQQKKKKIKKLKKKKSKHTRNNEIDSNSPNIASESELEEEEKRKKHKKKSKKSKRHRERSRSRNKK
uniref:G-patch_2 domain-containing protein n=1 Tax=Glossina austeni TaxID=7395 RepID=A0A1A9VPD1_GLOAU